MTKGEFSNRVEDLIARITVSKDPKKPTHFYSAYIDDKLYRGPKGKTVWYRTCDVVNSLKHNTDLFRFLRSAFEKELYELHPEFFEKEKNYWQQVPYVRNNHRKEVENFIESKVDEWYLNHVQIREIIQ